MLTFAQFATLNAERCAAPDRDGIRGNSAAQSVLESQLRKEIGDTVIYLDLLAQRAGFSLEDVVREAWNSKSAEIGYPVRL